MPNIFDQLPENLSSEHFTDIIRAPGVRIERIVSRGHTSPANGWYDQEENEWVMVIKGSNCDLGLINAKSLIIRLFTLPEIPCP